MPQSSIEAAVAAAEQDGLLDPFTCRGEVRVAGRDQPVTVWTVRRGLLGPAVP
jgi:class 3 adenylate cyclase